MVLPFLDHGSIKNGSMIYSRATSGSLYHVYSKINLRGLKDSKPRLSSRRQSKNPGAFYLIAFKDVFQLLLIWFLHTLLRVVVATWQLRWKFPLQWLLTPILLPLWFLMLCWMCLKSPLLRWHWKLVPPISDNALSDFLLTLNNKFRKITLGCNWKSTESLYPDTYPGILTRLQFYLWINLRDSGYFFQIEFLFYLCFIILSPNILGPVQ